jgi:uncharacterized membrane protein (DUF4010 family)
MYVVAFVSGLADVDAMLISSVQMLGQGELSAAATSTAVLLAALANMLTKAALAWGIGGRAVGVRVAGGYLVVALVGMVTAAVQAG